MDAVSLLLNACFLTYHIYILTCVSCWTFSASGPFPYIWLGVGLFVLIIIITLVVCLIKRWKNQNKAAITSVGESNPSYTSNIPPLATRKRTILTEYDTNTTNSHPHKHFIFNHCNIFLSTVTNIVQA